MTAAEIRAARQRLGLSQAQLAALLGYRHGNRISDLERGRLTITEAAAKLLQAYLDGYRPPEWPGEGKESDQ